MSSSHAPLLGLLLLALPVQADPAAPFPLWPDGAPGALGKEPKDIPTLTVYQPDPAKATGAAFVICPGGGYGHLADHEGAGYAVWLAENGITGIVLKYRLGGNGAYHHPAMLQDASRAVRLVRSRAAEWKLDPHRIGIMGSSAGGHLASTLLTHNDAGKADATDPIERESSRPDLGVLCYAVISLSDATGHIGSRFNLIGDKPPQELIDELSNEKHVTANTPPCFLWHTYEDKGVKVANCIDFATALNAHGVPFELHIYEKGSHGIGLGKGLAPGQHHRWSSDLLAWLTERGWLTKPAATP